MVSTCKLCGQMIRVEDSIMEDVEKARLRTLADWNLEAFKHCFQFHNQETVRIFESGFKYCSILAAALAVGLPEHPSAEQHLANMRETVSTWWGTVTVKRDRSIETVTPSG